jgi:hypothetical protein
MGIILLMTVTISCDTLQNICKTSERLNGEVIYAIPSSYGRTVTLQTENGQVVIYRVPLEQPLYDIPVCKHRNKYYWVMP